MRTHSFARFTYGKELHPENGEPSIERPNRLHGRAHDIIAEAFNKQEIKMKQEHDESRRQFIQKSAVFGTGMILARPASQRLFAQGNQLADPATRVTSKGYARPRYLGEIEPMDV